MPRPEIRRFADRSALARGAAEDIVGSIQRAITEKGSCRIALAGGSTPRPVYRLLVEPELAGRIDWQRIQVFWGDERCVPPTDEASNYRMVDDELLAKVPIPQTNVHRIAGELAPREAARAYEMTLGDEPLDLVLLGMGDDGHTASLFPDTPGLGEHPERVISTVSPVSPVDRVSLTLRSINEAGTVRFWVAGAAKADRLAEVFRQIDDGSPRLPAARVQPHRGHLCWLVDTDAAGRL